MTVQLIDFNIAIQLQSWTPVMQMLITNRGN